MLFKRRANAIFRERPHASDRHRCGLKITPMIQNIFVRRARTLGLRTSSPLLRPGRRLVQATPRVGRRRPLCARAVATLASAGSRALGRAVCSHTNGA